jgi:hypothetical protein
VAPISDVLLGDALGAAMNYLKYVGAVDLNEIEEICVMIIRLAYERGERNPVKLANCAINALEKPIEDGELGPLKIKNGYNPRPTSGAPP